jgi:hypothetical protein
VKASVVDTIPTLAHTYAAKTVSRPMTTSAYFGKPEVFSGRAADLQAWLCKFELYTTALGAPDDECALLATSFMSPSTLQMLGLSSVAAIPRSWGAMRQHLWNHFFGADQSSFYHEEVGRTTQQAGESIETFAARLGDLVRLANQRELYVTPAAAIAQFIAGLRDEFTRRLLRRDQATDSANAARGISPRLPDYAAYVREARLIESHPTCRLDVAPKAATLPLATAPQPVASIAAIQPAPQSQSSKSAQSSTKPVTLESMAGQVLALEKAIQSNQSKKAPSSQHATALAKADNRPPRGRCFNCNKTGHTLADCPLPQDLEAINRNREAWQVRRDCATQLARVAELVQAAQGSSEGSSPLCTELAKILPRRPLDPSTSASAPQPKAQALTKPAEN